MQEIQNIINLIENEQQKHGNTKARVASVLRLIVREIEKKINIEEGKVLSTNDFTNELKEKLDGLQNADIKPYLRRGEYEGTAQELKEMIDNVMVILESPDTQLDSLREIVTYIKQNKKILSTLDISNIAGLEGALEAKADKRHTHSWSDITDTEDVATKQYISELQIGGENLITGGRHFVRTGDNAVIFSKILYGGLTRGKTYILNAEKIKGAENIAFSISRSEHYWSTTHQQIKIGEPFEANHEHTYLWVFADDNREIEYKNVILQEGNMGTSFVPETATGSSLTTEQAQQLENAIQKDPEAVDKVLLANGETISQSDLKGDKGDTGERGQRGERGADGKSAYQVWLDAGNQGSEQDFLNYLKNIATPEPVFEISLEKIQESGLTAYRFMKNNIPKYSNILIKDGLYELDLINGMFQGIRPKSGSEITFEPNAVIKVKPNNFGEYAVFSLIDKSNVTFHNPQLIGDKDTHLDTKSEFGMGFYLNGAKDIKFRNIKVSKMWGDGIFMTDSKNIEIEKADFDDNRRTGIVLDQVDGFTLNDFIIQNTKGTEPAFGLNIEPDFNNESSKNVKITNGIFRNNGVGAENKYGFALALITVERTSQGATPKNTYFEVEMENVSFEGGDSLYLSAPLDIVHGYFKGKNITINGGKDYGIYFANHQSDNFYTEIDGLTLKNCIAKPNNNHSAPINFHCTGRLNATKTSGTKNIHLKNVRVISEYHHQFKSRAIINSSSGTYTEDMKNVSIEDLIVKGYNDVFSSSAGFDNASPDFKLSVDVQNSLLPKQATGTYMHLTHSKTQVQYADNDDNPILYVRNTLRRIQSEVTIQNNAQNMQPLKVGFVGNQANPTILKKFVDGLGDTQLAGLRIPYGAYVKFFKTTNDRYQIVEMTPNVTGLPEIN